MNVTRTAVERAAGEILGERIEVDHDKVAEALAREIVNEHIDDLIPDDAIDTGVAEAIDEIDEGTFGLVVDVIRDRVGAEVEGQAKNIALRMLRDLAAKVTRDLTVEVQ